MAFDFTSCNLQIIHRLKLLQLVSFLIVDFRYLRLMSQM